MPVHLQILGAEELRRTRQYRFQAMYDQDTPEDSASPRFRSVATGGLTTGAITSRAFARPRQGEQPGPTAPRAGEGPFLCFTAQRRLPVSAVEQPQAVRSSNGGTMPLTPADLGPELEARWRALPTPQNVQQRSNWIAPMRKIPTLFLRDPDDMRRLTRRVHPDCRWVLDGEGEATRKYDGTCVMLDDDGEWWARREVKPGKTEPKDFVEVEHDTMTGKRVGWEPVGQSSFAKVFRAALEESGHRRWASGTYELCGPKVNGNPEKLNGHWLIEHGTAARLDPPRDYDRLAEWLRDNPEYEGIVWHHPEGRMAKIKRRDVMP